MWLGGKFCVVLTQGTEMLYIHCSSILLQNAIGVIQVNQEGLKLNWTQLSLYNDDVNLLGENMNTVLKNMETISH